MSEGFDLRLGCARAAAAMAVAFTAAGAGAQPCRLEEGKSLLAEHRIEQARQLFEDCARNGTADPATALALGRFFLSENDDASAVRWLEQAARLDAASSEVELWLGRAYGAAALHASLIHQPALARKVHIAFEHAVDLDPGNIAARLSLVEYYVRAPRFLGGSLEKARAQAQEIRRRDPLKGHRAFGDIAEHEKRFDAAAEEYERAIAEFPDSPDPIYWRAELAERQRDYDTAFDRLEALRRRGNAPEALYRIGELAARSGRELARGKEALSLYLEHRPAPDEPSLAWAHLRLAAIHDREKNRKLARREYEAALELDPMLTPARQALAKLR